MDNKTEQKDKLIKFKKLKIEYSWLLWIRVDISGFNRLSFWEI